MMICRSLAVTRRLRCACPKRGKLVLSAPRQAVNFPKQPAALAAVLKDHDLALVSGWYSGTLINNDLDAELDRIADQLALFKAVGASVIVYGETFNTVQNRQEKPLTSRPRLADFDIAAYGRRLTALAEHCAAEGVPLTFHHHGYRGGNRS